ncbi:MAG: MiaB/RimO family radical SAM methylthiotransferase [Planctomycetes bacterium]|nr:MiaB/RimO family radical SAM methylthiotransferase [Planctomycetota bacterium]
MNSMPRSFYIQTVGCQMNVLDSELIAAELRRAGYVPADGVRRADVVLLNTCSVRAHAEDKIYSALGRLKNAKQYNPRKIIGVLGCMAQKDRQLIFRRAPHVDLVVGPGRLHRLPELLARVADGGGPCLEVSLDRAADDRAAVRQSFVPFTPRREIMGTGTSRDCRLAGASHNGSEPVPIISRSAPHQAMVRIMSGCDKFCSYCVVPRVRGPEQSRPAAAIVDEVRRLADAGCLEVILLGQTVNGYKDRTGQRTIALADLLAMLDRIEGLRRIKFVTNHPRHITKGLLEAVRDLPKVSPYLHVPAQSGSDAILRRMKRGYGAATYREMLDRIRETVPNAAVTSDFIVGFCSETEEDFRQTVELVHDARFKNSFIFKYSPRPETKAAELYADDVPEAVKRRRNNELLAIQNAISLEDNQPYFGRVVEILVEGPSKAARKQAAVITDGATAGSPHPGPLPKGEGTAQLVGRTVCDRIVVFDGPRELTGRIMPVRIDKVDAFTLFGSMPAASYTCRGNLR